MKKTRIGALYIISIWLIVFVLLGSVLFFGYRRNIHDLEELNASVARMLINIISVSTSAGIHAIDEIENITVQRLLDNARFLAKLSDRSVPSPDSLSSIAHENDLYMINILDSRGNSISRGSFDEQPPHQYRKGHRMEVKKVLDGFVEEEIIGFMDGQYYHGKKYGVVVKRPSGGAVVVNTDSEWMLNFRKTVGLGNLFNKIGERDDVHYVVLQDTIGIIAASQGVVEMIRITEDPFLLNALMSKEETRTIEIDNRRIFEVVSPLFVDDVNLGLVRIGLSTKSIENLRIRAARQFLILFFVALLSGVFVIIYVILRQNYMLLNSEHDRILQDVRHMEEETQRTERFISMGRLASAMAHEIRNPLNAISLIAQRLKAEFRPFKNQEKFDNFLGTVISEGKRISAIVEEFLKYARPPKPNKMPVKLSYIVNAVLNVVTEKSRKHNISISIDFEKDSVCQCDEDQMKQVFLNLILNALDAVPDGGRVLIKSKEDKQWISISISDNGGGITAEILPKIFDPYFTTKKNGTGLGLSEVHRIITSHGGRITVENDRDGAVFRMIFPKNKG